MNVNVNVSKKIAKKSKRLEETRQNERQFYDKRIKEIIGKTGGKKLQQDAGKSINERKVKQKEDVSNNKQQNESKGESNRAYASMMSKEFEAHKTLLDSTAKSVKSQERHISKQSKKLKKYKNKLNNFGDLLDTQNKRIDTAIQAQSEINTEQYDTNRFGFISLFFWAQNLIVYTVFPLSSVNPKKFWLWSSQNYFYFTD